MNIPPQDLLKPSRYLVNQTIEVNDCVLLMYTKNDRENDTVVIMGDIFFENYYVIWDFDTGKIGFNGYFALKQPEPHKPDPVQPEKSSFPGWAVFLLILVGLGTVGGLVYLYIRYKRKKMRKQFLLSNEIYDFDKPINQSQDVTLRTRNFND
jgi:Eukaryotic aspartyl protease